MIETGQRIKKARLFYGLRQGVFAGLLVVDQSYLSIIENGKRKPSKNFLSKLEKIYKVNPEWVLSGNGEAIYGEKVDLTTIIIPKPICLSDKKILKVMLMALDECCSGKPYSYEIKASMIVTYYKLMLDGIITDLRSLKNHIYNTFKVVADILEDTKGDFIQRL